MGREEVQRWLLRLIAISNQARNNIDETVDGTTMTGMLNLRNVFELIDNAFDDGRFAQKQFIDQRQQAVFHVFLEFGDELNAKCLQELFKEWLRDITAIGNQLAKQAFTKRGDGFAVIDIGRRNLASQDFTTLIDDQVELEAVKPAHGTLASFCEFGKYLVSVNAMVVTHPQSS